MNAWAVPPSWRALFLVLTFGLTSCTMQASADSAIPSGRGTLTANLGDLPLEVFTYRPDGCTVSEVLLVFHGLGREAANYRDDAIPVAKRLCVLIVAPLFDATRFPTWRYQHGGIIHDGVIQPAGSRTVDLVPRLVAWVRAREQRPELPYAMLGHSAGGQFLSRIAAFGLGDATRIVIANPSTWVRPSLDIDAPYGFGRVDGPEQGADALRRYLAEPITVLLGNEDVGAKNLAMGEQAEGQGNSRLQRGQNVFREAGLAAAKHGWPFNWRLAVVPGVGHSAAGMFGSEQAIDALRP